ncbi:MAG: LysR family transcriptional regulator [Fluviibacter sp.]|jgi:DNA-binding transcriptional LysR family regulator
MNPFKEMQALVLVATHGSLSAAARVEGVTPAIMARRLDALEERLGSQLIHRTTRRVSLTEAGQNYLEDCVRILNDLASAEASAARGSIQASGHLRVTAPAGFGRRHVAPHVQRFLAQHQEVSVTLDLSDRLVDLVNEGFDCGIRLGELADSNLVSVRLAEMRRVVVGAPEYLARRGEPQTPDELLKHECLALGPQRGWTFRASQTTGGVHVKTRSIRVKGPMECNDGVVLAEWARSGDGLAWRSMWEVGEDLQSGRLVSVLDDWAAPPVGIYAVFPERRHLPLKVRAFVDLLKDAYAQKDYWLPQQPVERKR